MIATSDPESLAAAFIAQIKADVAEATTLDELEAIGRVVVAVLAAGDDD